jgi:hypothetical protein
LLGILELLRERDWRRKINRRLLSFHYIKNKSFAVFEAFMLFKEKKEMMRSFLENELKNELCIVPCSGKKLPVIAPCIFIIFSESIIQYVIHVCSIKL